MCIISILVLMNAAKPPTVELSSKSENTETEPLMDTDQHGILRSENTNCELAEISVPKLTLRFLCLFVFLVPLCG